jgi:hypothetical protein
VACISVRINDADGENTHILHDKYRGNYAFIPISKISAIPIDEVFIYFNKSFFFWLLFFILFFQ